MKKTENKLSKINEYFYQLVIMLRETEFDFCAYIVEEAYRFYMAELEKRFNTNKIN